MTVAVLKKIRKLSEQPLDERCLFFRLPRVQGMVFGVVRWGAAYFRTC